MSAVEERTAEKRSLDKSDENEVAAKEPRLDNGKDVVSILHLLVNLAIKLDEFRYVSAIQFVG